MADFFIFGHQERQEKIFKERKFIEDVLDEELNNYRFSRERLQAFAEDFRQSPHSNSTARAIAVIALTAEGYHSID